MSAQASGDLPSLPSTHSPSSTVLTADRLEETPVFQRTTLPDAIVTAAPGMIRGHDDFVHIRGHEIALNPLINGVSFWENPHAVFSAGFSPDVIDTANVMTGGFPAEYGNRFGGVVDIVTKSGLRMENSGAVAVSVGGAGRARAAGEFGGRRGSAGYFVAGSMFASDTHLVGLPHIHVAGQEIAFSGAESGGQISADAQDSIQLGCHLTADVGIRVDRYDLVVSKTHASLRANLASGSPNGR